MKVNFNQLKYIYSNLKVINISISTFLIAEIIQVDANVSKINR